MRRCSSFQQASTAIKHALQDSVQTQKQQVCLATFVDHALDAQWRLHAATVLVFTSARKLQAALLSMALP